MALISKLCLYNLYNLTVTMTVREFVRSIAVFTCYSALYLFSFSEKCGRHVALHSHTLWRRHVWQGERAISEGINMSNEASFQWECCCLLLYRAIIWSRAYSLHLHVILHEWISFIARFWISPKSCTYNADMAGAASNCCHLGTFSVHYTTMHYVA